jgi:hypothetical protein
VCEWHLKLKRLKLLLKSGDHRCSLLEVKVLLLNMVLKVYNGVSTLVHHRASGVQLLTGVVPPMLGLTEAAVRDLQIMVLA